MECLENLVGLQDCEGTQNNPYQLQQVGLSRVQLEQLVDSSYPNIDDWFTDMRKLAAAKLTSDFTGNITQGIKAVSMLENGTVGQYQDNKQVVNTTTTAGIYMDLWNRREYVTFNINSISLYTDHDGDVDINVVNVRTGNVLDTVTITAEAGKIVTQTTSIKVPNYGQYLTLALVYDTTGITSYKTTISNTGCSNCGGGDTTNSRYAQFRSIDLPDPSLANNVKDRKDTAGLTIEYSFECDQVNWLCSASNQLGLAMLYKTAYEMLNYAINSGERFTNQNTVNYEKNIERRDNFEFQYGGELEKNLKSIKFPIGDCFKCFRRTQIRTVLPG